MLPGIAMPIAAFLLYEPVWINLYEAGGIKKAQDPIMMGNATCGDIPSINTNAMQGA